VTALLVVGACVVGVLAGGFAVTMNATRERDVYRKAIEAIEREKEMQGVHWLHWYDDPHAPRYGLIGILVDIETAKILHTALDRPGGHEWMEWANSLRTGLAHAIGVKEREMAGQ
jgi:hypothetical protein